MANPALDTAQKVVGDKLKSELKDQIIKQVMTDAVGGEANKIFKQALGWTTLFIAFIEAYSKTIKAINLEMVKQFYETCPHIGQCENFGHAISIANKTTATVWLIEGFYYFHPQLNYKVRRSAQIMRTTSNGGWRIENPNRPEFVTEDCYACVEAHAPRIN